MVPLIEIARSEEVPRLQIPFVRLDGEEQLAGVRHRRDILSTTARVAFQGSMSTLFKWALLPGLAGKSKLTAGLRAVNLHGALASRAAPWREAAELPPLDAAGAGADASRRLPGATSRSAAAAGGSVVLELKRDFFSVVAKPGGSREDEIEALVLRGRGFQPMERVGLWSAMCFCRSALTLWRVLPPACKGSRAG
jgi:hypothetical protein